MSTQAQNPFQIKDNTNSVKDVDLETRTVTGYFAAFGNIDADGDMFDSSAFDKTIKENGPQASNQRIMHLYQHDTNQPLAKPHVLRADEKGLYFESKVANTTYGTDVLKLYDSGALDEHSVGFTTLRSEPTTDKDGNEFNLIKEVKLWEGSTVTWGANSQTPFMGFKSMDKEERIPKIFDKIKVLQKLLRNGTLTDDTFVKLEIELQQLKQMLADNLSPDSKTPDEESTSDLTPEDLQDTFTKFELNHLLSI